MSDIKETQIKEFIDIMSTVRRLFYLNHHQSNDDMKTTALQFRGLMMLNNNPGITVGELADRFYMSSAAIAQYLNRLEKIGLIEKKTDTNDKRVTRIFVSKEGRSKLVHIEKLHSDKFSELLAPLSQDELAQLITLLKKIEVNLESKTDHENS